MNIRAIILKKQNTNEHDQLVTCYTEELGKLTAIAKSILKPTSIQAMHLDIFNLVEFDLLNGRAIPIITGAQVENVHGGIKSNLAKLSVAYFFAEVIDKLTFDHQRDDELWVFMENLLAGLNAQEGDLKKFLHSKQNELVKILGYAPNLEECVFCSQKGEGNLIAFSANSRGAVCKGCFLSGQEGIVVKDGNFLTSYVLGSIFESLAERRIYSLNLLNSMVK